MLIPKFFLDKEDPELALKMERTLASADDYGSKEDPELVLKMERALASGDDYGS